MCFQRRKDKRDGTTTRSEDMQRPKTEGSTTNISALAAQPSSNMMSNEPSRTPVSSDMSNKAPKEVPIPATPDETNALKADKVIDSLNKVLHEMNEFGDVSNKASNRHNMNSRSHLLAEKITEKNEFDRKRAKEKKLEEMTCNQEDDDSYEQILVAMKKNPKKGVEKKPKPKPKIGPCNKDDDTIHERLKPGHRSTDTTSTTTTVSMQQDGPGQAAGQPKTAVDKAKKGKTYMKDTRQKSKKLKSKNSADPGSAEESRAFDCENEPPNEKNFMYNLKEIDYCSHDMLRCIDDEQVTKGTLQNNGLPEALSPFAPLATLEKRGYTTCNVLRRNTLLSTLQSMPTLEEREKMALKTADHAESKMKIKFLPTTTLKERNLEKTCEHSSEHREVPAGLTNPTTPPPATSRTPGDRSRQKTLPESEADRIPDNIPDMATKE